MSNDKKAKSDLKLKDQSIEKNKPNKKSSYSKKYPFDRFFFHAHADLRTFSSLF